jgi:hypothetical protein
MVNVDNRGTPRDPRGSNNSLYFIVGALVIAVLIIGWFMYGGDEVDDATDVNVTTEEPATPAADADADADVIVEPATPPATEPATPPAEPATPPATEPATPPATDPATPPATDPATPPATDPATPPADGTTTTPQ